MGFLFISLFTLILALMHGWSVGIMYAFSGTLTMMTSRLSLFKSSYIISRKLLVNCFLVLSFFGICITTISFYGYGSTFGPYGDDSTYLMNVKSIYHGTTFYKIPTLYEFIFIPYYWIASLFTKDVGHMHLISLNWFIASLIGPLSIILASQYIKITKKRYVYWGILALLSQSIFLDSVLNLYRDGLVCVCMLMALISINANQWKRVFMFVLFTALLRGGSALLLVSIIGLLQFHKNVYSINKLGLAFRIILVAAFAVFVDQLIGLGSFMRDFSGSTTGVGMNELLEARSASILNVQDGSMSEKIRKYGVVGNFLAMIITITAPLSFHNLMETIDVHIRGVSTFTYTGITPRSFLSYFGVFNTMITGPLVLIGITKNLMSKHKGFLITLSYLIIVFFVVFISFQSRHRLMFYIFHPYFVIYALSKAQKNRLFEIVPLYGFIVFIVLIQITI